MTHEKPFTLALLVGWVVLGSAFAAQLGSQDRSDRVTVENLRTPHPIQGDVLVTQPIPHSASVASAMDIVVAPAPRLDTGLWTDAGTIESDGFTSVVLSLHGQMRGTPSGPGVVAVVLVPDQEQVLRSFAEGEIHLALEAVAEVVPAGTMYLSGSQAGLAIGFDRYRMFLYNTTDRSASVNVFAYLTH